MPDSLSVFCSRQLCSEEHTFTQKSVDYGGNAAHGTVEDGRQLTETLHLVNYRHIAAGQRRLQELLSVHDDVWMTQVHRITQNV